MRYIYLLLVPLCLWTFVPLGKYYLADLALAASRKSTDPLAVYELANLAYGFNPAEPVITSELAYAAAYLAAVLKDRDASLSGQFTAVALAASDQSILQSPHNPAFYRSRARSLLLLSNIDQKYLLSATETLKIAQQLAPTDPRIPSQLYQITSDEKYKSGTLFLKPDYQFP